jgi:GH24 family phage-related lysozyme (muramidase)
MLSWEKFRPNVYADSNGNATIGWGHLIHYGPPTDADRKQWGTMTKSEADALFAKDSAFAVNAVQALVKQPLNQHQFDALVDFVFNVGTANFQSSTLLRDLNAGRLNRVPDDLRMWVVGGPGLKTRRDDEVALFTHGAYIYHD